jgi:uncharacterized damage-inducible protein DinB
MKESERILKLFEDLYAGDPWIGVNMEATLGRITAAQAHKKVLPGRNSIWEIVNHIISWRLNVLQRVQGQEPISPDSNYFEPVADASETAWIKTLLLMKDTQKQWLSFLKTFRDEDFRKIYSANGMTYYEHIHGILQHDAYHLGQIAVLAKLF